MSRGNPLNPFAMHLEATDGIFNPAKKNASLVKWDLDQAQEFEVSKETATQKTEENLQRSDIGPGMRRHMALSRELAEFLPESEIKDKEYQEARLATFLYDKIERRTRNGEMDPAGNSEDARLAAWFASSSRADLREEEKRAKERSKDAQGVISDINDQLQSVKGNIDKIAVANRISTVKKRGNAYYMVQRRTTGLVMPKTLPQEIVGNDYYKLFNTMEALLELSTEKVTPVLTRMLECTPIEHFNDRRILQESITKLANNKDWTRRDFLLFIQGTFSEDLEADFRAAFRSALMDSNKQFMLDLSMDENTRVDQMISAKKYRPIDNETIIIARKKMGLSIHDGLRESERNMNARLAREANAKRPNQAKPNANKNRRRGQAKQNGDDSHQSGQSHKNSQGQGGQKRTHPGNNGGGNNRSKKGPRAAPAKVEPKDPK